MTSRSSSTAPRRTHAAEADGAVLKCQQAKTEADATEGTPAMTMNMCVWADHSTVGFVVPIDVASLLAGKSGTGEEAAAITAKFRKEIRVKV